MHEVLEPSYEPSFSLMVSRLDPTRASLTASGEFDLAAAMDLSAALHVQQASGRKFIRLDLSAVTFMDCVCLGVLVRAHSRLGAANGQLLLTNVSGPVLRLLTLTDLTDELLIAREPVTSISAESA